jgi:hypothetical protein
MPAADGRGSAPGKSARTAPVYRTSVDGTRRASVLSQLSVVAIPSVNQVASSQSGRSIKSSESVRLRSRATAIHLRE